MQVAKWWAKRKGITVEALFADALWAYLLPVRADAP
jgi:hypothetical protein